MKRCLCCNMTVNAMQKAKGPRGKLAWHRARIDRSQKLTAPFNGLFYPGSTAIPAVGARGAEGRVR